MVVSPSTNGDFMGLEWDDIGISWEDNGIITRLSWDLVELNRIIWCLIGFYGIFMGFLWDLMKI